jgi:hypothetical protein
VWLHQNDGKALTNGRGDVPAPSQDGGNCVIMETTNSDVQYWKP